MTMVNLGMRLNSLGRDREAHDILKDAIKILPDSAPAWTDLSMVYGRMGRGKDCVDAARRAYALQGDPQTAMCLAFALLFDGQYQEGFLLNEQRFDWKLKQYLQYPYPKWNGEAGGTVFIASDQGLGDTLSFARFIPLAAKRAKFLHLYVQPALVRLFSYIFAHLPNVNVIPAPAPFPQADYWSAFISLPYALKLTNQEIRSTPSLKFPKAGSPVNWKIPDRKLHVGVAWAGSPLNEIDRFRSFPVEMLLELYRVPGIQLYSLQVGERASDPANAGAAYLIPDLSRFINDVTDTMALLNQLDMVICCESALGHIAAETGTECWHPYSWCGRDWRIGHAGEQMLWRPKNHGVFPQKEGESWGPAFDRIIGTLRARVPT